MRFSFLYNASKNFPWIGDRHSANTLIEGLNALSSESFMTNDPSKAMQADHIVLLNIAHNLNPLLHLMRLAKKAYSVIPFHEDYVKYSPVCAAFYATISEALSHEEGEKRIETLIKFPEAIRYLSFPAKEHSLQNYEVMKEATYCIANTHQEARIIKRGCKEANTKVIYWTPGLAENLPRAIDESFLTAFNLKSKEYLLQIGRLEPRKNQLATILATRNIDLPLVLVTSRIFKHCQSYAEDCVRAIKKYRKGPTIILSNDLPSENTRLLKILPLEQGLTKEMLFSAYQHAAALVHPAFYELPGYVYLEAAKIGCPVVASSWGTIKEYFTDEKGGYELDDRILYALPYDVERLEKLLLLQLGKSYQRSELPILHRSAHDVASEFLSLFKKFSPSLH